MSHNHAWAIDIAIFVVFFLINILVGFRYRGQSSSFREYAVGDKKFSTATLTATIVATCMSGALLFVVLEQTYSTGLYYIPAIIIGAPAGFLITGHVIGPRMGKFIKKVSVPDSLGSLYGERVQAIAGVCTALVGVGLIASQLHVIGKISTVLFDYEGPMVLIISAAIIILYSLSGGVKAVSFTDVFQFLTFGTLLPVLALVIWNNLADTSRVAHTLTTNPLFSFKELMSWDSASIGAIAMVCYYSMPDLYPQLFQRIVMARDVTQIKNSLTYSAILCLGISLCMVWIAILLLTDKPGLNPSQLVQYMARTYTYPGLRGFLGVGIMALAMSTADSALNACAVIIANDVLPPLGLQKVRLLNIARWATIILGVLGLLMALNFQDILRILRISDCFYSPIVVVPMLLAIFGFQTSRRVVLMAMGSGVIVTTSCLFYFRSVDSFFPGMLANLSVMMGAHYLLGEKGGWGNNPLPVAYPTNSLSREWYQAIRQFQLLSYLEKCLPKQDQAYLLLAFYIFTTTYASLYLLPQEISIQYPSLYKGLYYSVTLVTTLFLAFPIWPQGLKAKRLLIWIWPVSIFYTLFLVGSMLAILSGFELPQLMLLMLNFMMAILFINGPMATTLFIAGSFLAVFFFLQYTGLTSLPGSIGTLEFKFVYGLLLFSTSLIALFKHQQAYKGLEKRNILLKNTQEATSQSLLQALQHRDRLAQEMSRDSTKLFNGVHEISKRLAQETQQLRDKETIITARSTLKEANTKLKAAADYFDQIIYQVKDHMQLHVSTIPLQKLLQGVLQDLKHKQNLHTNTQVIVQNHTQQEEVQCDVETIQQLLVNGIDYAQQKSQYELPIFLSISNTTLGYPITAVQGYIKKVEALCITIASHNTHPIPLDLYMGVVINTGLNLSKLTTTLPLIRNQRIVEEHYGTTEFAEDAQGCTQIYIIPLRLREVRPTTMDLSERDIDTSVSSDTNVYRQESDLLKTLKMYPEVDIATVKKAIQLIKEYHAGVKRKSGEPFYLHPIAVAQILLHYTQDQATIIAALLHDTVEDTTLSLVQIGGMFDEAVQSIVDGVTHLESYIKTQKRVVLSAHENIQKLLDVKDNQVLYVKLADRLHNMRTIEGHTSIEKQKKIATETLQFFVPIARYLQLHVIEKELQQLASRVMSKL